MTDVRDSIKLSLILHNIARILFEQASQEDPSFDHAPDRLLSWRLKQTARPELGDNPPITWLAVELHLVAQSSGSTDIDLVSEIINQFPSPAFDNEPLRQFGALTGPPTASEAAKDTLEQLEAMRKLAEAAADLHEKSDADVRREAVDAMKQDKPENTTGP